MTVRAIGMVLLYAAASIFGWYAAAWLVAVPSVLPWWAVQPSILLVGSLAVAAVLWLTVDPSD